MEDTNLIVYYLDYINGLYSSVIETSLKIKSISTQFIIEFLIHDDFLFFHYNAKITSTVYIYTKYRSELI